MKKIWTTKNGLLGTVHKNREGKMVDFRQCSSIALSMNKKWIVISPPKGQNGLVSPLELRPDRSYEVQDELDYPNKGQVWKKEIFCSYFEGVEISVAGPVFSCWYDKEAEKTYLASEAEKTAKWSAKLQEERSFLRNLRMEEIAEEFSSSDIGRLRAGKSVKKILREILRKMLCAQFESPGFAWMDSESECIDRWRRDNGYYDRLEALVINCDNRQREERKQKWLAKV